MVRARLADGSIKTYFYDRPDTGRNSDDERVTGRVVYFIYAPALKAVKIGHASNVYSRLSELQTGSPVPLYLVATIAGGAPEERLLHAKFAHLRKKGEWFEVKAELADFVRANARRIPMVRRRPRKPKTTGANRPKTS